MPKQDIYILLHCIMDDYRIEFVSLSYVYLSGVNACGSISTWLT